MGYALPVEVIYTTPLLSWNPYDLPVLPVAEVLGHGTRRGGHDVATAYNGTNRIRNYYMTPSEFYASGKVDKDNADTAKSGAGVLDKQGNVRIVDSSGIRIKTPDIEGVGPIRTRYPIMPVHGEGSGVWKELNALKDMTMHMNRYASLYEERPGVGGENDTDDSALLHYKVALTVQDPPGEHSHDVYLNKIELDEIKHGHEFYVTTSEDMAHSHELTFRWDNRRHALFIKRCDGLRQCWDGHNLRLIEQAD